MIGGEASVGAGADAQIAADTVFAGRQGVAVPQKLYLSDGFAGADPDTFPARRAFARIECGIIYCIFHILT